MKQATKTFLAPVFALLLSACTLPSSETFLAPFQPEPPKLNLPQPQAHSTGVIGPITAAKTDGITVNGLNIYFPTRKLMVDTVLGAMPATNLRVGHVVSVETQTQRGRKVAQAVTLKHVVAGPVQSIDPVRQTFSVLGQTVRIPNRALFAEAQKSSTIPYGGIQVNQVVAVSGLRNGRAVEASRVDASMDRGLAAISGLITGIGDGLLEVDGIAVRITDTMPVAVAIGRRVNVTGRAVDGVLHTQAAFIEVEPPVPFNGRMRYVLEETYAQQLGPGGPLRLGDIETQPEAVPPGQRVRTMIERTLNGYTVLSLTPVIP